jgi:hypothetical protein
LTFIEHADANLPHQHDFLLDGIEQQHANRPRSEQQFARHHVAPATRKQRVPQL